MVEQFPIPETHVLAIASHVVYGHVGNTMATFVMQSLGCDVAALNTVQYSNHLGYGRATGLKTTASQITDLYEGLKDSHLADFDMLLSGYLAGAESIVAVGVIARELKFKATLKPGSFFWLLDPVMGDNGHLYVPDDTVPAFRHLIRDADMILPNQFEAETLSGVKIVDMDSLTEAITVLHQSYRVPHIIITSVSFPAPGAEATLSVIGSTVKSAADRSARLFRIRIPAIDCFFSGTGDMFAALMLVRFRQAVIAIPGLINTASWISHEDVQPLDLPLAKAAEMVLASMHEVLTRTKQRRDELMDQYDRTFGEDDSEEDVKKRKLMSTRAAEVSLVRNRWFLEQAVVRYKAEAM